MRVTRFVPLGQIQIKNWKKMPLNPTTLKLVAFIAKGGEIKPIKLQQIYRNHVPTGRFQIKDGRHRFLARKMLGHRDIEARFWVPDKPVKRVSLDIETPSDWEIEDADWWRNILERHPYV